ncbi:protoheme IX farnesyltransferase [Candidatus Saccharibacteria bacterium]|nr:protoheme IX farnesyltransferase [Candidatus Saccharibacteria bacterium]
MASVRAYYELTKPGIIYGNLLTAAAGFLLAARWQINWLLLISAMVGTSLVIASACVFNNYIDRGIDLQMARTRQRAIATGAISGRAALVYGAVLGLIGIVVLILGTNWLTLGIGLAGFIIYVALYGYSKRKSVYGTIIGSVSGAAPIAAGYTAVTNHVDGGALLLFSFMVIWQMPHFYAIALYRLSDYTAAHLPVLPVVRGVSLTRRHMIYYMIALVLVVPLLTVFGYTGYVYLIVMVIMSLAWLRLGIVGVRARDVTKWARQVFLFSLVVLVSFSVMVAVGGVWP